MWNAPYIVAVDLLIHSVSATNPSPVHGDGHGEAHEGHHEVSSFQIGLLLITFGLLLGSIVRFVQKRIIKIPIPYTVVMLLFGILMGYTAHAFGRLDDAVDQVKRVDPHVLLAVFIPALIYESAFDVNYHIFSKIFGQALLLAGPGVMINAGLTVLFGKYVLPHDWYVVGLQFYCVLSD